MHRAKLYIVMIQIVKKSHCSGSWKTEITSDLTVMGKKFEAESHSEKNDHLTNASILE